MKLVYILVGALGVGAMLAVGLIVAKGPQPEIIVPAEIITKLGPVNISNTMISSWLAMAFLIGFSFLATRSMKLMPGGAQNFLEAVVSFLVGQVEEIAGETNGRRFFSVVATIFLFIIVSNWMGLLPFFNAIGKTEDVGHHIFHEIETHHAEGKPFEKDKFAAWFMDKSGGVVFVKPGGKAVEFEVSKDEDATVALDRYIVFLAENFTGYEKPEGHLKSDLTADDVKAAAAALAANPKAPKLLITAGDHSHQAGELHGVISPGLNATIDGIDFPGQKLALVVPLFRGAFSDVNNTLAMGIVAFFVIEFWGFQALGLGYLGKFFVNPIKSPIGTFVGFLELLSEFIRVISFTFRLFGNIFAGEVLVLMLTFLMPFLAVDIIYGLELFVGFIQAAVFALLTLVFATMATEHHGEEGHADGDGHGDAEAAAHDYPGAAQAH